MCRLTVLDTVYGHFLNAVGPPCEYVEVSLFNNQKIHPLWPGEPSKIKLSLYIRPSDIIYSGGTGTLNRYQQLTKHVFYEF